MPNPMIDVAALDKFRQGDAQTAIDAATRSVRDFCGWHVGPSLTETVTVRGDGTASVWLPSMKVTTVASVLVDGAALLPGDFEWLECGLLTRTYGWFNYGARIDVDLTHGHDPVPESVTEVVMARATRLAGDPGGNVAAVAKGPFSTQYNTGGVAGFDPKTERDKLLPYRIPRSR